MRPAFYDSIEPYLEAKRMSNVRIRDSFKTPLIVEVMPSGKKFRLFKQFTYNWKGYDGGVKIAVPVGFVTDFASIPPIARLIIPKLGKWNKPAVIHDYIYQNHNVDISPHKSYIFNRWLADRIFLDGLEDSGVVKWKRYLMYWGVRLFGWLAWKERR